jgi:hypothetical protein
MRVARAGHSGMGKPWLEGFKFFTYLAEPIALTVTFAVNPENLESIIRNVRARDRKRSRMTPRRRERRPDDDETDETASLLRDAARVSWCTRRRDRDRLRANAS